jgi:hypothetical protein
MPWEVSSSFPASRLTALAEAASGDEIEVVPAPLRAGEVVAAR